MSSPFSNLADEVLVHIFSYLDLQSLGRCAQVSHRFRASASDYSLFRKINLFRYRRYVNDGMLVWLSHRCRNLVKLELANNYLTSDNLAKFIMKTCNQLTTLTLYECSFVDDAVVQAVASTCRNLKELSLELCMGISPEGFSSLHSIATLEVLDLSCTRIAKQDLLNILKASPLLKHIEIWSCYNVESIDEVTEALSTYNTHLVSVELRGIACSMYALQALSKCQSLQDLSFHVDSGDDDDDPLRTFTALATGCPQLQRLIMKDWLYIRDQDLEPLLHCQHLRQINMSTMRNITEVICSRFLHELPELELLNLIGCPLIREKQVIKWRQRFPHVRILHEPLEKVCSCISRGRRGFCKCYPKQLLNRLLTPSTMKNTVNSSSGYSV